MAMWLTSDDPMGDEFVRGVDAALGRLETGFRL